MERSYFPFTLTSSAQPVADGVAGAERILRRSAGLVEARCRRSPRRARNNKSSRTAGWPGRSRRPPSSRASIAQAESPVMTRRRVAPSRVAVPAPEQPGRPLRRMTRPKRAALPCSVMQSWLGGVPRALVEAGQGRGLHGRAGPPASPPGSRLRGRLARLAAAGGEEQRRGAATFSSRPPISGATNDKAVTICAPGSAGQRADMLTTNPFDTDKLHEECGVFGVWGADSAAALGALGLHALQHRGQEAAGHHQLRRQRASTPTAAWAMSPRISTNEAVIRRLQGRAAIGHVRYSTTGETALRNVQPLFAELALGGFAVAHNGNISNAMTAARRPQPARLDLPVDQRHRGDHPPRRHVGLPHPARPLHRRAEAGRGRLLPGLPDQ